MYKSFSIIILIIVSLLIIGCATPGKSTFTYTEPDVKPITNEITIDKKFEYVWDELVKELAKSYYVINNIEKASRIINVSFFTNSPADYIDCGHSFRTYTQGNTEDRYSYDVADSSSFKVAGGTDDSFLVTHYIQRKTNLEGRINIYVAPVNEQTQLSVNARYIFISSSDGVTATENINGQPIHSQPVSPRSEKATFSTNQPIIVNWGTSQQPLNITCQSKGRLEKDILTLVK